MIEKMTTYEITLEGVPTFRLTSLTDAVTVALNVSKEHEGDFVVWLTEYNPETGGIMPTQIVTVNNGEKK